MLLCGPFEFFGTVGRSVEIQLFARGEHKAVFLGAFLFAERKEFFSFFVLCIADFFAANYFDKFGSVFARIATVFVNEKHEAHPGEEALAHPEAIERVYSQKKLSKLIGTIHPTDVQRRPSSEPIEHSLWGFGLWLRHQGTV